MDSQILKHFKKVDFEQKFYNVYLQEKSEKKKDKVINALNKIMNPTNHKLLKEYIKKDVTENYLDITDTLSMLINRKALGKNERNNS